MNEPHKKPYRGLEVVTHCWSVHVPEYAEALKIQGCSLATACVQSAQPPGHHFSPEKQRDITWTVVCNPLDQRTQEAIRYVLGFWHAKHQWYSGRFTINVMSIEKERLFRRAIGRNIAALKTNAQAVWFTDCDYFLGEGAYEAILEHVQPIEQSTDEQSAEDSPGGSTQARLYHPETVMISRDHVTGDAMLKKGRPKDAARYGFGNPAGLPESMFVPKTHHIAIGGIQIVHGETANRVGYLEGTKWVQPVESAGGFRQCRCDRAFRKHNKFLRTPLPIEQIYRIRHLEAGRDYDDAGNKTTGNKKTS